MLFQKEKEDKNQINRLDQKRERRSRRAFFLLSPISRKTLSGKVSLCTFLKKASLTLETAMALPLFFSECSRCFLLWIFTRYRRSI
ncbi:hypothetical protein CK1_16680 [Ruminococcus sp. SR1/5]|nr:hypothetical protein CK1_16680 [Ruminococcus sp. SR1/5]